MASALWESSVVSAYDLDLTRLAEEETLREHRRRLDEINGRDFATFAPICLKKLPNENDDFDPLGILDIHILCTIPPTLLMGCSGLKLTRLLILEREREMEKKRVVGDMVGGIY